MLGALDSSFERAHEEAVKPETFAMPALPGLAPVPDPNPAFANKGYAAAHKWFVSKNVVDRDTFDAMSESAKRKAFTVAQTASHDMLVTARDEIAKQIAKGADLRDFRKAIAERMQSAGWTPANPSHAENIYRTNIMGAYNTGRFAEMRQPAVLKARPYWQVLGVNDARTRKEHKRVQGWVFRADDPGWHTKSCPFGYMCRCRVRSLSQLQVDKLGLTVHSWDEVNDLPDEGFSSGVDNFIPYEPPKEVPLPAPAPKITPGIGGRGIPHIERKLIEPGRVGEPFAPASPKPPPPPPPAPKPSPLPEHGPKPAPAPPPPPLPGAAATTAENVMHRQLAGAKGSNPGGVYLGSDGVERYVKLYEDRAQAACEHLANSIYRDLKLAAPESEVFELHDGKYAYASKMIPGVETLKGTFTAGNAKKAMNGFAADVLLANWDAAGMELDNFAVAGGKLYRLDNGGSLLYRAKTGRKNAALLNQIPEWEGFLSPSKNPAYAKVAAKAGISSPADIKGIEKQLEAISKLHKKSKGWSSYVEKHAPGLSAGDHNQIVEMLEARTKLLAAKLDELKIAAKQTEQATKMLAEGKITEANAPLAFGKLPAAQALPQPSVAANLMQETEERVARALPTASRSAVHRFTGSDYREIRAAARLPAEQVIAKYGESRAQQLLELAKHIDDGYHHAPAAPGVVVRGIHSLSPAQLAEMLNAKVLEASSPCSTTYNQSTARSFMGGSSSGKYRVFYQLEQRSGMAIRRVSSFSSEAEVLVRKGTRFEITSMQRYNGDVLVVKGKEIAGTVTEGTTSAQLSRHKTGKVKFGAAPPEPMAAARRERFCPDMSDDENANVAGLRKDGTFVLP